MIRGLGRCATLLRLTVVGAGVSVLAAPPARAAEPTATVQISGSSLRAELIQLATRMKASLSLEDGDLCAGPGPALSGRFTMAAGLDRLLEGGRGAWRRLGPNVFEVTCRDPAKPRPSRSRPPPPQPSVEPALELSQMVVVATRRPAPADRLAYPVSALSEPMLVGQGVHDLSDLALLTPAMTVTNLGMGSDKILLRGLSDGPLTGRTQSMVGLYLDDVRLTYNAPDPDLRLVDMETVEVLRGPQGASYGAGSMGGVVHMVTAEPDPSRVSGWVSATGATTDGAAGSHSADAMLNLPLPGDHAALRVVVYEEFDGGYINDSSLHLHDVNPSARTGARLAYETGLGGGWDLTAGLVAQAIDAKDAQYAQASAPPYTRANLVREPHDNNFDEAHVRLHGRLDGAEVQWSTAYILHSLYSRYDATATLFDPVLAEFDPALPDPVPGESAAAYDYRYRTATLVSEGTVASAPTAKLQWLLGAFAARSFLDTDAELTELTPEPVPLLTDLRHDRLDEAAVFGETVLPLASSVDLTVGGRLFTTDTQVTSQVATPLSGVTWSYHTGLAETGFAPKVVLAYHPSPYWLAYVQGAQGYRPGGFNSLYPRVQPLGAAMNLPWRPFTRYGGDRLWSVEAGGKAMLLSDTLRLRGAIFETFWSNLQSDRILWSGLPSTANLGYATNYGLELESAYRLGGLDLKSQLVLNSPELERAYSKSIDRSDFILAVVPDFSAGASARYVRPLSADRSLELDGYWTYLGRSRLVLDAVTAPRMGNYATGRLAASLRDGPWRWTLALENPADVRANTFAYGNPFAVRSAPEVTPLRPRTLSIGFRRDF